MPNITISIDETLLNKSRQYAREHNTSLNSLIRTVLKQTVEKSSGQWIDDCFSLMDELNTDSKGKKWKREELYDV